MRIGICAWSLPGEELDAFEKAAGLGLEGVVIDFGSVDAMNKFDLNDTKDKYMESAMNSGVAIPTMSLNFFCQKGMIQKENRDFAIESIERAIDTASYMGIDKLQIPSFYDNLILTDEDLMNTAEVLKRCTGFAETKGVLLGSESVMTIAQHKKLYELVDSPMLTTLYDTQNPWRMLNQDGVKIAAYMAPFTGELHAKDSIPEGPSTMQLGQGDVGFEESMKIFAARGYEGWIQLESKYPMMDDYKSVIKKDMEILKSIFTV